MNNSMIVQPRVWMRILIAMVLWWFILMLASAGTMTLQTMSPGRPWLSGLMMQSGILLLSLLAIALFGKGRFSQFGFARPSQRFFRPAAIFGLTLGVIAGVAQVVIRTDANPAVDDLSFLQIVLLIWIWASICEEVLYRGLIQSYLAPFSNRGITLFGARISLPVAIAALLFALSHAMLLTLGMAPGAVIAIVIFALLLGALAGYWREKTGSLLPAIIVHMSGNIAGACVGYLADALK